MIVYCMKDGLTANERVYLRGELFKLPDILVRELGDLPDDKLAKKQKRIYNEQVFRRPTAEELRLAFVGKQFKLTDFTDKEKRDLATALKARKSKESEVLEYLEKTTATTEDIEEVAEQAAEGASPVKE